MFVLIEILQNAVSINIENFNYYVYNIDNISISNLFVKTVLNRCSISNELYNCSYIFPQRHYGDELKKEVLLISYRLILFA